MSRVLPTPRVAVCALLLLLCTGAGTEPSPPDSWLPFQDKLAVSASGRHYAILRAKMIAWPGPFELVRRRPNQAPPTEKTLRKRPRDPLTYDRADELLATGTLKQLPMDAAVSDQPLGIVLFDQYARVGYGQTLAFLDANGRTVWSHKLEDLFGGEPKGTTRTVSSRWWSVTWGHDEHLDLAWALTHGGELRTVDLATGAIRVPDAAVIAQLCQRGTKEQRIGLMDAVLANRDQDAKVFLPTLQPIALDKTQPMSVRLRAAALCARAGDEVDYAELFQAAARGKDVDDAIFAAVHASDVVSSGREALEWLTRALRHPEIRLDPRPNLASLFGGAHHAITFTDALKRHGADGVDHLRATLASPDTPTHALISMGVLWWKLGQTGLPNRLEQLILEGSEGHANSALNAMIHSEIDGLAAIMLRLVRAGTADDGRVALYFKEHPQAAAIPALERMLETPKDDTDERWIQQAIDACRRVH